MPQSDEEKAEAQEKRDNDNKHHADDNVSQAGDKKDK